MNFCRTLSPRHILILEYVALTSMVIDHLAKTGLFRVPGWEVIGRLAFPLFAITFAANAARYQRCNISKLMLIGLVAQPAASIVSGVAVWQLNVMFVFPAGWLVYRYFADHQTPRNILLKPFVLVAAVAFLATGPSYGFRGTFLIAVLLGFLSCRDSRTRRYWAAAACAACALTLAPTPERIIPVGALLALTLAVVALVPAGQVERKRTTWWNRAGFGKWYVVQAYVLCAAKAVAA